MRRVKKGGRGRGGELIKEVVRKLVGGNTESISECRGRAKKEEREKGV